MLFVCFAQSFFLSSPAEIAKNKIKNSLVLAVEAVGDNQNKNVENPKSTDSHCEIQVALSRNHTDQRKLSSDLTFKICHIIAWSFDELENNGVETPA